MLNEAFINFSEAIKQARYLDSLNKPSDIYKTEVSWEELIEKIIKDRINLIVGRPSNGHSNVATTILLEATKNFQVALIQLVHPFIRNQLYAKPKYEYTPIKHFINTVKRIEDAGLKNHFNPDNLYLSTDTLTPETLLPELRQLHDKTNRQLRLVLLDDVTLLFKDKTTQERLALFTKLKELALELDLNFVILGDIKRRVENRKCKKPKLHDVNFIELIGSQINNVLACYNPSIYDFKNHKNSKIELFFLKQKN